MPPFSFAVDGLSATMLVTLAVILVAVLVFAAADIGASLRFYVLMLVFAVAMAITVTATNIVTLLVGWEIMGAMSYALIAFWWREPRRATSGAIAFLTTRAGDLGLYLAAGAAFANGQTDLSGLSGDLVAAGIVIAALGKSAQLPFSFWLSRAMDGPSPVSALLHSATMVAAGAYLLIRVNPLLEQTGWAGPVVAWVGVITALVLGAVAVAQTDFKQMLAASTCSQVGFMVLAAGTGGAQAGTAHLVAHAAIKSLLFLAAGAWLTILGTKQLPELRGAARKYPLIGVTFTIGALSLAGVPPLSLWITKDAVLATAPTAIYVVGLAAVVLSGVYVGRALQHVWAREGQRQKANVLLQVPLPFLAAAAAVFGLVIAPELHLTWWELVLSGGLAIVGIALGRVAFQAKALEGWLGLEPATRKVIVKPTMALAAALARFDDKAVDGGVRAAAATGDLFAKVASGRIEVTVDGVVHRIGAAAKALGRWARRPQTGQLHHYYAQAAVALALLAVLLMIVR
ncbi:NADH-quinone oxidoreductase subunit L [Kibdelosporangium philippinense]|uniref:NADH-quinone oxidoreductase subunit L n=1 Tax=Kibdelosporangium philippinense TaxID=211113 RepID=A0ABS8ZU55_9PSEU|nr:proton-conducting transporter membrane subunit [Kibdelosporangium philippinense]MCE7010753.1 NADH-quinone oxidoreductase subunit L [Kibdelosporangium philippinense]